MENLTQAEKAQYQSGMRDAATQGQNVYKTVAALRAIGDQIPKGVSINGEDAWQLVLELEKRGIVLPTVGISATEVRSLRDKVAVEMPRISLRGIPWGKGKAKVPVTYDAAKDIDFKYKEQLYKFELELMSTGDTRESLQERIDASKDPLLKIANRNNPKRK
jgi:hypothetical protein